MKRILFAIIALMGIVACELEPDTTPKETLKLFVDNAEIYADGTQTATFTVKDADDAIVNDATIYHATTNEALPANSFSTKYVGSYSFYAMRGNERSNTVTVTAKEKSGDVGTPEDPEKPENPENPEELVFAVAPTTIVADGVEKAVFTLTQGEEAIVDFEVYNAATDSKLAAAEFSTTEAGNYSFYAMYEGEKSNSVDVVATAVVVEPEKPITLEATATTIKANGVDYTKFTVMQDGADVTNKAYIYVNGGRLNGNRFVTTTPGTYTVYAEKGTERSNEITITAEEVTATGKTIVFADGVTVSSGWYDVNKYKAGNNGDIQMCWAASASNILQWWQDRYVAEGGTLPATAINGPSNKTYSETGCKYQLALMDMFHSEWDNTLGGHVNEAIPWYFEGKLNGGEYASAGTQAVPKTDGGYWKSVWSSVVKNMYCDYDYISLPDFNTAYSYTVRYNNYELWGNGSSLEGTDRLKYVSDLVVRAFEHGMASMTISLASNIYSLHHAVTLWGYEIDNTTGLLTRIWITDSDDMETEPKSEILHEMSVSIGEGKSHIQFSSPNIRYKNVWLVAIVPVSGPNSAE